MFEYEDWGDVLMLLLMWAGFWITFPVAWWFLHHEWIAVQMLRTVEGWALLGICFISAVLARGFSMKRRNDRMRAGGA